MWLVEMTVPSLKMSSMNNKLILACAVASGTVIASVAAGYWLYRRRRHGHGSPHGMILDNEDLCIPVGTVDKLWNYPLKSAHRVDLEEIQCTKRGFKHDRCWVVVDDQLRVINQKKAPKLATVFQSVEEKDGSYTLVLTAPGYGEIRIPQPDKTTPYTSISFFGIAGSGQDTGDKASEWISTCIGVAGCRVYYMSPSVTDPRKPNKHTRFGNLCSPDDETSFSNFCPVLVLSNSSLDELNTHSDKPVEMTRFRPNIVLSGCSKPHEEDTWKMVRIGESCILRFINPDPRCPVTTIDQDLGEAPKSNEPLDTLNTYRRYEQVYSERDSRYSTGPLFGANYAVVRPGVIKAGDTVYTAADTEY